MEGDAEPRRVPPARDGGVTPEQAGSNALPDPCQARTCIQGKKDARVEKIQYPVADRQAFQRPRLPGRKPDDLRGVLRKKEQEQERLRRQPKKKSKAFALPELPFGNF